MKKCDNSFNEKGNVIDLFFLNRNTDVYDYNYNYDHMKVMGVLAILTDGQGLDWEDLANIAIAIYDHWVDGRDASEDDKYALYPWLEFENSEEDGYIQKYTQRVGLLFLEEYKKEI